MVGPTVRELGKTMGEAGCQRWRSEDGSSVKGQGEDGSRKEGGTVGAGGCRAARVSTGRGRAAGPQRGPIFRVREPLTLIGRRLTK